MKRIKIRPLYWLIACCVVVAMGAVLALSGAAMMRPAYAEEATTQDVLNEDSAASEELEMVDASVEEEELGVVESSSLTETFAPSEGAVLDEPALEEPALEEAAFEDAVLTEPALNESPLAEATFNDAALDDPALEEQAQGDLLLGVYFNSEADWTNSIFASSDGFIYRRISTAYRQQNSKHQYKDSKGNWNHYPQQTPSIVYWNGKFWILSGWNRQNGKIWPTISYSTDLKHWTHPDGEGLITGTRGIPVDSFPVVNGRSYANFDIVAPEWYISKNGSLYIIVSCGYYGAYHGQPANDQMTAYIVKVTELSASAGIADGNSGYLWPSNLRFRTETAKKLPFTSAADYIDGAAYNNGDYDYLVIKKAGLINQVYRTSNIDNPSSWQLVNAQATYGYEGASIAKLGSTYYMMADKVEGITATGVKLFKSSSIATKSAWSGPSNPLFLSENDQALAAPRHGSLLTLKAGSEPWKIVKALFDKNPIKGKPMYRLYNPNSGEHFYTGAPAERDMLVGVGWRYEGVGWFAPSSSKTPVYRLYNPNAGDHHYTMNPAEKNMLVGVGWRYEGIGWYSNDAKKTPLYRQYNPNARTGTHNYTMSKPENDWLVSLGWRAEGIGWYGM